MKSSQFRSVSRSHALTAAFVAALLAGAQQLCAQAPEPVAEQIRRLAAETDVVLRATVRVQRSATWSIQDVEHLAVARLDELISGPRLYRAFEGRDITIRLKDSAAVRRGEQRIFFVSPWFIGETVGVIEVGSIGDPKAMSVADISSEVRKEQVLKSDGRLKADMDRAQAVVVGSVVALRLGAHATASEHDPVWSEADIAVSKVLKGAPVRRLTILFPASTDVMWYAVPKPSLGQSAVWILKLALPGAARKDTLGYASLGSVLPVSEVPRVERVLQK